MVTAGDHTRDRNSEYRRGPPCGAAKSHAYGGRSPVRDFLTAARLSSDDRDEILAAMKDVEVNGLPVARHLSGDVYEVRADGRQATYRVLFAAEGKSSQVLLALSAFSEKTRRTPPDEVRLAERRLTDWRARARTE